MACIELCGGVYTDAIGDCILFSASVSVSVSVNAARVPLCHLIFSGYWSSCDGTEIFFNFCYKTTFSLAGWLFNTEEPFFDGQQVCENVRMQKGITAQKSIRSCHFNLDSGNPRPIYTERNRVLSWCLTYRNFNAVQTDGSNCWKKPPKNLSVLLSVYWLSHQTTPSLFWISHC